MAELGALEVELLKASEAADAERVRALLAKGANIDAVEGAEAIPRYVLSNVDEPEQLRKMGYGLNRTPLLWALLHKDEDLAHSLLEQGADPALASNLGESPLALAACMNSERLLEFFKAAKVKLDKAGAGRNTPLMLACESGAAAAVRWLLAHKAKPNRKNSMKETALGMACRECHPEVVKILLEHGAEVNADGDLGTPLKQVAGATKRVPLKGRKQFIAVHYTDQGAFTYEPVPEQSVLEVVELLLNSGADPNLGVNPPLAAAAMNGYPKVVKRLIEGGANPNARDIIGSTALENAKLFQRDEVIALLSGKTTVGALAVEDEFESQAEYAPVPDLSEKLSSNNFQSFVAELEELAGSQGTVHDNHVELTWERGEEWNLEELQERAKLSEAFLCERAGRMGGSPRLLLVPSTRWQDAVAILETNGINYDLASQNIIDWLQDCEKTFPFRITGLSHDLVAGEFLSKIDDPQGLAEKIYEFCPDTVDQGFGELEELAVDLESQRKFFFWWD